MNAVKGVGSAVCMSSSEKLVYDPFLFICYINLDLLCSAGEGRQTGDRHSPSQFGTFTWSSMKHVGPTPPLPRLTVVLTRVVPWFKRMKDSSIGLRAEEGCLTGSASTCSCQHCWSRCCRQTGILRFKAVWPDFTSAINNNPTSGGRPFKTRAVVFGHYYGLLNKHVCVFSRFAAVTCYSAHFHSISTTDSEVILSTYACMCDRQLYHDRVNVKDDPCWRVHWTFYNKTELKGCVCAWLE